ncbi:MAG: peptidyl-prolyl cis-trans isomerase [Myxococcota bacterium]
MERQAEREPDPPRRARGLLGIGALAGLGLALLSLLGGVGVGRDPLPEGAIARVNQELIQRAEYERAVEALEAERGALLDEASRRRVLERLVDEALLVQYGLELGLGWRDLRVRQALISAVVAAQVAEASMTEPSEAECREFYDQNRELFRIPGRVRVRRLRVRGPPVRTREQARERALGAARRLRAGEPFASLRTELGDAAAVRIPDALIPPSKLHEYLGASLVRRALRLEPGAVTPPLASGQSWVVLQLVEREPEHTPAYAEIADQVSAELRRRQGDRALRRRLDALRGTGRVEWVERVP